MKTNWSLGLIFLLIGATAMAQEKTALTLRDAVIGAYGEMKPQSLSGFSWLPEDARYSYKKGEGDAERLIVKDTEGDFHTEVTLTMLNDGIQSTGSESINRFPSISWKSNSEFLFDVNQSVYTYNLESGTTELALAYTEKAQNKDFNPSAMGLAYTVDNNLFVQLAGEEARQVTHHTEETMISGQAIHRYEFGIRKGTFWSPGADQLAFYEKDDSQIPEFPIVDYKADPVKVKGIRYPHAGKPSQIPKVGGYNLNDEKTTYLQTGEPKEKYLTNLTWSEDGKYIYIAELNRDQRKMDLVQYNAATGARVKVLFTETHDKYVEPEHGPIFIPEGKGAFLWFSERDGFNHLYHYKSDGKLLRQVTSGDYDVEEVLGFDEKGKHVFLSAHRPALEKHLFKVKISNGKTDRITTDKGYHTGELSADGKYLMVSRTAPNVPARSDIISAKGDLVKNLLTSPDPLENKVHATIELTTLKADDSTTLYGRLVKPSFFDPEKKYPVVVYVYGGPHVQLINKSWLYGAGLWMLHLAEQGYLVFTVDNRGSANRGLDFEQATFRNLGAAEIADQLTGVEYLKSLPYADTDNMAVYGWSFGGFMATSLMLRTPGIFNVAVAGGAVTDWRSYEVMYTERYMDTPEQNPEGYQRADLKNYTENLQGELLLIHGTSDDVVILDHTMDILNSFIDKGIQVDYFNYPGYAHNVRGTDRLHLKRKIIDYVMERIPPQRPDDEN